MIFLKLETMFLSMAERSSARVCHTVGKGLVIR